MPTHARFTHNDVKFPTFKDYRRDGVKEPRAKDTTSEMRKGFTYLMVGGN